MNPERTRRLYTRYPALFPEHVRRWAPIAFGFQCDDGWVGLLDRRFADLLALCRTHRLEVPELWPVKEKFGALRVYGGPFPPVLAVRIRAAEAESRRTCKRCGAPGRLGRDRHGVCSVRCATCAEAHWHPLRPS